MKPTADEELQKRIAVRASADKALIEWRTSKAIRRSVLRATRGTPESSGQGERVSFWRQQRIRKGKRIAPRYVVGNVLGPDRGDNLWVSSGGHCISVAKEQLRKAYGTELWVPEDEDIRELTKASESKDGKYYDENKRRPKTNPRWTLKTRSHSQSPLTTRSWKKKKPRTDKEKIFDSHRFPRDRVGMHPK